MSQNDLIKLVGLTYEAVDDPLAWAEFFTNFAKSVPAGAAGLIAHDKAGRWAKIPVSVGVEPSLRKAYEEQFVALNPWQPRSGVYPGAISTSEYLATKEEIAKSEFYNEFMRPYGWSHVGPRMSGRVQDIKRIRTRYPGFY